MTSASELRPDSLSLKTRFALVSVALFLISVWGMAAYVANELKADMEDLLAEQQRAMASSIAQAIGTSVRVRRESLTMTAADIPPGIMSSGRALADYLRERQAMQRLFDVALIVTSPTGQVLARYPSSPGSPKALTKQVGLLREIVENRRFAIGPPGKNEFNNLATVPFGAPVLGKNGEVQGVLLGISSLLTTEFVDHDVSLASDIGYLVVSKTNRRILTSQDKSRIMEPAPAPGTNPLLDRFLSGYEGSGVTVNARGIDELSSSRAVKDTDWIVTVSMPAQDAFDPVNQMRKRILFSAASLSIVVALLTWLFVRQTLRPLEHLVRSVRTMGAADAPIGQLEIETSTPEFRQLIGALNRMQRRITDQAAVLSENEARFHFVADNSPMLIWISDESGQRIWFNHTWLKRRGQLPGQALDVSWLGDIHPDDRTRYAESFQRAMNARNILRTQFRLRDAAGAYKWFLEMAIPRIVEEGKLVGYVGSCLDIDEQITAQNKAEALLRENRKLMAERFNVEEAERARFARDLHDDLGQSLTAIHVNAEAICAIADREGLEKIHHCADSIVTSTTTVQDYVRAVNRKLGPDTLTTLGLAESIEELVRGWLEFQQGLVAELALEEGLGRIDSRVETAVFRMTQEALTNISRHSRAAKVSVALSRDRASADAELVLVITDDGIGFDQERESNGVGLIGMRERTLALGGNFSLRSARGSGTSIEVRFPIVHQALAGLNDHAPDGS